MNLSCEDCGTQYVGKGANKLQICMNLHRRGKTGCQDITEHFKSCCKGKAHSIQVIEALADNDHDENGVVDENNRRLRVGREDIWMKILRTNILYGLSKRSKDFIQGAPIGTNFYPNEGSDERNDMSQKSKQSTF